MRRPRVKPESVTVWFDGEQHLVGVGYDFTQGMLTSAEARQAAQRLSEAADEADRRDVIGPP